MCVCLVFFCFFVCGQTSKFVCFLFFSEGVVTINTYTWKLFCSREAKKRRYVRCHLYPSRPSFCQKAFVIEEGSVRTVYI